MDRIKRNKHGSEVAAIRPYIRPSILWSEAKTLPGTLLELAINLMLEYLRIDGTEMGSNPEYSKQHKWK